MLLVLGVVLAEDEVHQVVVLVHHGQGVDLVVPDDVVGLFQGGGGGGGDELLAGGHEVTHGHVRAHPGHAVVAAGDQAQELAGGGGVLGDGDGGEAVLLLQGQHVAQRCVRGQVRGTDDKAGLAALHPADHGGLILNGLGAVDEGQAALLGQGHGQGVVGDSLHDGGDHGDVQADGALLLPLAVLHQGGLQGDVVGYTLLRGEPRHQQVLAEGMGGFGIVKSHVRLLLSFFSKYHLKYSTAERKSFISYSPGTLRYRPAPVRSLWPILPNTRPSGEVMPSTAQTELLGLK